MKKIILLSMLLIPFNIQALEVSSKSAILMDEDTGRILYKKGIDDKRLIASTTKIMTAVIALESGKMDDLVTVTDDILKLLKLSSFKLLQCINKAYILVTLEVSKFDTSRVFRDLQLWKVLCM